jgi:hypothetical protein
VPHPADDEVEPSPPARRGRVGRRIALAVGVLVGLWLVASAMALRSALSAAADARQRLGALAVGDVLGLDPEALHADLRATGADLDRARSDLAHPLLVPLRPLPVLGRQLASGRAMVDSSASVLEGIVPAVERVIEARRAGSDPDRRIELLAGLEADLEALQGRIDAVDLGPDAGLVGSLLHLRQELHDRLSELDVAVEGALVGVRGLQAFFDGSDYLLLGANNAEMDNAGGMYLSIGEANVQGGEFRLAGFRPTHEIYPPPGVPSVDPDVADRWGFLHPTNDFRKLSITPRFAEYVGPQALDMWEAETGRRPDGVLAVDPFVLNAILEVIGPVEADGRQYGPWYLLDYLLRLQYQEYEALDAGVQAARREALGAIAGATVAALGERSWDPIELLRALRPAAAGRHVLAYSDDPVQQEMWELLGVAGEVTGDEVLVNVANLGGSKLDPYLEIDVTATTEEEGGARMLHLAITLTNWPPEDLPAYAAGPVDLLGIDEPGTYVGRLLVFGPAGTRRITVEPDVALEAYGRDGPLAVLATRFRLPPRDRLTYHVTLELEPEVESIEVLPSARTVPAVWAWYGELWHDRAARVVTFDS